MRVGHAVGALAFALIGCGTVQNGPMQRIHVSSEPPGATVTARDCGVIRKTARVTPTVMFVSRRATKCTIQVSLPDYFPARLTLERRLSPNSEENLDAITEVCASNEECDTIGDAIVAGLVGAMFAGAGVTIDLATGGLYELQPSRIDVKLQERFPERDAQESEHDDESTRESGVEPMKQR